MKWLTSGYRVAGVNGEAGQFAIFPLPLYSSIYFAPLLSRVQFCGPMDLKASTLAFISVHCF